MAPKMVANFRRSLSFPNNSSTKKPKKTFHVRSTSLPACRSHPLISQLKDEINELKSFVTNPEDNQRSTSWLCECLNRLKTVHESLDDLLQIPQTRESLSTHVDFIEKLLEDFLRFVDVYAIFRTLILSLKEEHSAVQVAVRRKDDTKTALYLKGLKKIAKETKKLVVNMQRIGQYAISTSSQSVPDSDVELAEAIKSVVEVTISVSVMLFNRISSSLPSGRSSSWMRMALGKKVNRVKGEEGIQEFQQLGFGNLWGLRKMGDEDVKMVCKKMHGLEDCIDALENCSGKVFRSLINARVSLLNILT